MYFMCFQEDDDDHDCTLDLEDILNLDTDTERMQYAYVSIPWHLWWYSQPHFYRVSVIDKPLCHRLYLFIKL